MVLDDTSFTGPLFSLVPRFLWSRDLGAGLAWPGLDWTGLDWSKLVQASLCCAVLRCAEVCLSGYPFLVNAVPSALSVSLFAQVIDGKDSAQVSPAPTSTTSTIADAPRSPPDPSTTPPASSTPSASVDYVRTDHDQSVDVKELRSANGRFRFVVLDDASLVLYMDSDAIWAIHTDSASSPKVEERNTRLVVQTDGNLLLVHHTRGPTWSSDTACGAPGPFTLAMKNDGNCVLYDGNWAQCWATKTSGWHLI